jgi:hypothetical protein
MCKVSMTWTIAKTVLSARKHVFNCYKYAYIVGGYREHNTISIVMPELYYFIVWWLQN